MPFDFQAAIKKPYRAVPVPKDFIPSRYPSTQPHGQFHSERAQTTDSMVGCSDSFIVETECLDVLPQEIFVHRNLGNILSNGDLSSRSAVEWAVGLLKVDHIIVCGHYDCALIDKGDGSALGGWHKNITKLHALNEIHMVEKQNLDDYCRHRKLEEVYVLAEVGWLRKQECVKKAIEERGLQIHGFVFDKATGGCVELVEG